MTEQKCVRTYDKQWDSITDSRCISELNAYLECGWEVVMVTPKTAYNEYILKKEVDNSRME